MKIDAFVLIAPDIENLLAFLDRDSVLPSNTKGILSGVVASVTKVNGAFSLQGAGRSQLR
jgi:hypothetical protein